ncbi:MAG: HU family DNA-binding protein [Planctomycetota bacterium]
MAATKKPMTQTQIMSELAERCNMARKDVKNVVNELVQLAYENADPGFKIPGLGKLVLVHRKARTGRNPMTGEPIQIPAKTVLKFRISKAAKEACEPGK